jgi:hypothetical protein
MSAMRHRPYVRNNVQEPRTVDQLREALSCANTAGDDEHVASVLKQIRQELATEHALPGAAELHREACQAHGAIAAKQRDLIELLALADASGDAEWGASVAVLAVALLREQEEEAGNRCVGRETELNALLEQCPTSLARVVAALVAGNVPAVARATALSELTDPCLVTMLAMVEEATRLKVKARFDKCFRGTHRLAKG